MPENSVLILGSGMVARPIIQYLLRQGYKVTVASNTPDRTEMMINGHVNGKNVIWSAQDEQALSRLVAEHDITVSLLPYAFHVMVAKHCLKHGKNMITTSYVKPEMQVLNAEAKAKGIIILNELGLDPGIDHMSAMRIIDHVHDKGGKIKTFYSICGALPAPEACNNPFRYKFSWSPKGVIMAGNNDAVYLKDGKEVEIPTKDLFKNPGITEFPGAGTLEIYPNRDSISYIDIYGIPETDTIMRGTFRMQGWCRIIDAMKKLHLFSYDTFDFSGLTFAGFLLKCSGFGTSENIRKKVADFLEIKISDDIINALEWLGLFDEKAMNRSVDSSFEITSDLMIEKMMIKPEERDMVVLQHTFLAEYPDGKNEVIRSRMLDFGTPREDTSVARTVALPAAIGVDMILKKQITLTGVHRPVHRNIYDPILNQLEKMNIKMQEEFGLPENLII